MKKNILYTLCFCVIIAWGLPLHALLADYTFSQATNQYAEITGGVLLGDETTDDQRFINPAEPLGTIVAPYTGAGFPIGFNFNLNNFVFDVVAINANGWISLGQSSLGTTAVDNTSTSINAPIGSVTTTVPPQLNHRIAGFARDMTAQTGSSLRLETIGTAPNRICVIQWKNYKRWGTAGAGDTINFQIQLHEHLNKVAIAYGLFRHGPTPATTFFPQVGIRGIDVTDFVNRTTTTDWDATTAGTVNTANCTFSSVCMPHRGLTFEYVNAPDLTDDLEAVSVTGNTSPHVGSPTPYTINVRNNGSNQQADYTVKLMNGLIELASVSGPTIESGASIDVVLNWTPSLVGATPLSGLVTVAGDQDSLNNQSPVLDVNVLDTVYGTLVGRVRKPDNSPISGAIVTAGVYTATSSFNGGYTMPVAIGTYSVTCTATNYSTVTNEDVTISEAQNTLCDFYLFLVPNDDEVQIANTGLNSNYPNPFYLETTIRFELKGKVPVRLDIYNTKGQLIRTLANESKASGRYEIAWNGKDNNGIKVASGIYQYRMQAGEYHSSRMMLMMK